MGYNAFVVFWVLVLVINISETTAEAGGAIYLGLKSLQNYDNTNYQGSCCDDGCQPCNYRLEIWVDCDAKRNNTECFYGYSKTGTFSRTNHVIFNNTLGNGLKNPLVYNFTLFQGNLGIEILATDHSGSKIGDYRHHKPYYPKPYYKKTWENITLDANGHSNSKLFLSYNVFCNEHYYGPSCSVGCLPGKTYTCDENSGRKLCKPHWLGPECNCTVDHQGNCDISTGKRLCYLPWHGQKCDIKCEEKNDRLGGYTCDKNTGRKICLSGWFGTECNLTAPVVPSLFSKASGVSTRAIKIQSSSIIPVQSREASDHLQRASSKLRTASLRLFPSTSISTRPPPRSNSCSTSCHTKSPLATAQSTSHVMNSWAPTMIPVYGTSLTTWVSPNISTVRTQAVPDSFVSFVTNSNEQSIGTSVKARDHTGQLSNLPQRIKSTITVADHISQQSLFKGVTPNILPGIISTTVTSMNVRSQTVIVTTLPQRSESKVTSKDHTPHQSISNYVSQNTPIKYISQGSSGSHTEQLESWIQSISATKAHNYTQTSSFTNIIFNPGSREARKRREIWWIMLLTLTALALLTVGGLLVFRSKMRKRCEIFPQYEIPLESKQPVESSWDTKSEDNTYSI